MTPKGKATKGSDLSSMKIRAISADKKIKPAKILVNSEKN